MTDDDVVDSLERHFMIGNAGLTTTQLAEHRDRGSCKACDQTAAFIASTARLPAGTAFNSSV